jgi:hypothetical protein
MRVTNNKEFEEYDVQEYFVLDHKGIIVSSDDDEGNDLSYFSNNEIPIDKIGEVDDKYFDDHLIITMKQHQLLRRPRVQRTRSPP